MAEIKGGVEKCLFFLGDLLDLRDLTWWESAS